MPDSPVVKIVWDNVNCETRLPEEVGQPREDQAMGSPIDVLVEAAGRVSYDSWGRGRTSQKFHEHIRDVKHLSVLRHPALVFGFDTFAQGVGLAEYLGALIGRPGVQLTHCDDHAVRFTANLQAAYEWAKWPVRYPDARPVASALGRLCHAHFAVRAPLAAGDHQSVTDEDHRLVPNFGVLRPITDEEVHASLFISNVSRISADELIRHTFNCSPSVRSTRFCPEDKTPWVLHPLLRREGPEFDWCRKQVKVVETGARVAYSGLRHTLEKIAADAGTDGRRAHKQALGAARGILGLSLATEMIFTLSLAAARHLFALRLGDEADEEIAEYVELVRAALTVRFPGRFPTPDTIKAGEATGSASVPGSSPGSTLGVTGGDEADGGQRPEAAG